MRYRSLFYLASLGRLGGHFEAILGPIWAVFWPSLAVLGPCWSSGGILEAFGPLGALLGASWGGLGGLLGRLRASEARKGENLKTWKHIRNIDDSCLLGLSWEDSWGVSEAS